MYIKKKKIKSLITLSSTGISKLKRRTSRFKSTNPLLSGIDLLRKIYKIRKAKLAPIVYEVEKLTREWMR